MATDAFFNTFDVASMVLELVSSHDLVALSVTNRQIQGVVEPFIWKTLPSLDLLLRVLCPRTYSKGHHFHFELPHSTNSQWNRFNHLRQLVRTFHYTWDTCDAEASAYLAFACASPTFQPRSPLFPNLATLHCDRQPPYSPDLVSLLVPTIRTLDLSFNAQFRSALPTNDAQHCISILAAAGLPQLQRFTVRGVISEDVIRHLQNHLASITDFTYVDASVDQFQPEPSISVRWQRLRQFFRFPSAWNNPHPFVWRIASVTLDIRPATVGEFEFLLLRLGDALPQLVSLHITSKRTPHESVHVGDSTFRSVVNTIGPKASLRVLKLTLPWRYTVDVQSVGLAGAAWPNLETLAVELGYPPADTTPIFPELDAGLLVLFAIAISLPNIRLLSLELQLRLINWTDLPIPPIVFNHAVDLFLSSREEEEVGPERLDNTTLEAIRIHKQSNWGYPFSLPVQLWALEGVPFFRALFPFGCSLTPLDVASQSNEFIIDCLDAILRPRHR